MTQQKNNTQLVAIITMCFIFAMISFVTNMGAPFGNIWGFTYPFAKAWGNLMNFAAYLFMGIPAGKMLIKYGYKKTALIALIVGIVGLLFQYLSSLVGSGTEVFTWSGYETQKWIHGVKQTVVSDIHVTLNLFIYLFGAFICGFCVCMLNTVVNPMLNLLGGGGNKGNQLIQVGGTLNSLTGTLTPLLAGILVGEVTSKTSMSAVAPLLFIGIAVFAISFIIISRVNIPEPTLGKEQPKYERSPLAFRHCLLGVIAIFFYVGIEIGIPMELNFYVTDYTKGIAALGGAFAAAYWLLMMIGRAGSSALSGKISTRTQLICVSSVAILLLLLAIFIPKTSTVSVPKFIYNPESKTTSILENAGVPQDAITQFIEKKDFSIIENYSEQIALVKASLPEDSLKAFIAGTDAKLVEKVRNDYKENLTSEELNWTVKEMASGLDTPVIPISAFIIFLCGLCTSIMWGGIFNLSVEGLGKYTEAASGIFMAFVVGGGIMPLIQEALANTPSIGIINSYWLVIAMLAYILFYALIGCKNVNKDIKVD